MQDSINHKICVDSYNGFELFHHKEILYFKIENEVTYVKLTSYRRLPLKNTLRDLENKLREYTFYRIHAQLLVNFLYIRQYVHKTGQVTMADDVVLKVAKDRKAAFKSEFENLFGKTAS